MRERNLNFYINLDLNLIYPDLGFGIRDLGSVIPNEVPCPPQADAIVEPGP